MQVALLGRAVSVAARRCAAPRRARRQRREDRLEPRDRRVVAADHQAVAALEAPDAAADADIDVVDAARRKRLRAADVVDVVRVAAVDRPCRPASSSGDQLLDDRVDDRRRAPSARRRAARSSFADELLERGGAGGALARPAPRRWRRARRTRRSRGRRAAGAAPCCRPSARGRSSRLACDAPDARRALCGVLRCLMNSITIGSTDTSTMPIATSEKFSLMIGTLPNR